MRLGEGCGLLSNPASTLHKHEVQVWAKLWGRSYDLGGDSRCVARHAPVLATASRVLRHARVQPAVRPRGRALHRAQASPARRPRPHRHTPRSVSQSVSHYDTPSREHARGPHSHSTQTLFRVCGKNFCIVLFTPRSTVRSRGCASPKGPKADSRRGHVHQCGVCRGGLRVEPTPHWQAGGRRILRGAVCAARRLPCCVTAAGRTARVRQFHGRRAHRPPSAVPLGGRGVVPRPGGKAWHERLRDRRQE